MTVGHVSFDPESQYGRKLRLNLDKLQEGRDELNELQAAMVQMLDGDGSQAAHFDYFIDKFGFASNVAAKACFDELSSMLGKLNTDGSVSNVHAAMNQCFAKLA